MRTIITSKNLVWLALILSSIVITVSAFSMSSGSFSSSSGTSSSLGFSTETLIMTGGPSTPAPTPAPSPGGPAMMPSGDYIPPHWLTGTRSGTFFDPITQTSWFFDNVLQKFYSPTYGWFLVTQLNRDGSVYAQFYYDPKLGVFRDMTTGASIMVTPTGTDIPIPSGPVTPPPSGQTTPSGGSPIVAATQPPSGTTAPPSSAHPCRIPCSTCPEGYCDDCNQNGICDDEETSPVISSTAPGTQPTASPSPTPAPEGGLSEEAQSTIYYNILLPTSGIRSVVACDPYQGCDYCLDIDDDGVCTLFDYAIILCDSGEYGLDYMGSPDGKCDPDMILIMDCDTPASCTVAQFCRDFNMDGVCDKEGDDSQFL